MNKEPENSDSDQDSRVHFEDSSSEDTPHNQDSSFEAEEPAESDSEKSIDEDSATKKISYGKKGWLFLLLLIITIGAGGYFYAQKNGIDLPISLSSDLKKSSPFAAKKPKPSAEQSKTRSIKPAPKINEQSEKSIASKKSISENEKTINLLRDEIRSLKTELTKKNSTPPQNVQNVIPHISGRIIREKTKGLIWKGEEESDSEMKVLLTHPLPIQAEPNVNSETSEEETGPEREMAVSVTSPPLVKAETTLKQNQHQKISPQKSKEVQAYLDFIENTGNKLVRLIKKGWVRLQALILYYGKDV